MRAPEWLHFFRQSASAHPSERGMRTPLMRQSATRRAAAIHRYFVDVRSDFAESLRTERDTGYGKEETMMIRGMKLLAVVVAMTTLSGCATIAGGLIGTGVGVATGHPVSGALIGTGMGMMIDTAARR